MRVTLLFATYRAAAHLFGCLLIGQLFEPSAPPPLLLLAALQFCGTETMVCSLGSFGLGGKHQDSMLIVKLIASRGEAMLDVILLG